MFGRKMVRNKRDPCRVLYEKVSLVHNAKTALEKKTKNVKAIVKLKRRIYFPKFLQNGSFHENYL